MKRITARGATLLAALALMLAGCGGEESPTEQPPPSGSSGPAIKGRVVNGATSEPVSGAVVTTLPPTRQATTGADGWFTIDSVPAGAYTVIAVKPGTGSGNVQVTIVAGSSPTADVAIDAGSGNGAPELPFNPRPSNDAVLATSGVRLSWSSNDPDGDAVTYDVYFGAQNPPTTRLVAGHATRSIESPALEPGKQYYWMVAARDARGAITPGPVWRFTTQGTEGTGNVLHFDGVDDYGIVDESPELRLSGGSYTLEAWVKLDLLDAAWRIVLSRGRSDDELDYLLGVDQSRRFLFAGRSPANVMQSLYRPDQFRWYHLAMVHDVTSGSLSIYVDGALDYRLDMTGSPFMEAAPLLVGARDSVGTGMPGAFFAGDIDELRIWGRALTAGEINAAREHVLSGGEQGLVAYWSFDRAEGSEVPDETGHGHVLRLRNGAEVRRSTSPVK